MRGRFKKKLNRRYTMLVVPEGTNPVFRFKFHFTHMLAVLIAAAVLLGSVLALFAVNRSHTSRIGSLEAELSDSSNLFVDKEKEIDRLLSELMELSEKSKTIEAKMSELEQLEAELKSITKDGITQRTNANSASLSKNTATEALAAGGVGGDAVPIMEQDIASLVEETKKSITSSLNELPKLQQRLELAKSSLQQYKKMMLIFPTFWPTESVRITSRYGERDNPFDGRGHELHKGLDIGGGVGDPVYAAADGTVTDAGHNSARGNYITVSHPSGLSTIYMHLSKIEAEKGDSVKQGEKIAEMGSTGRSTGPHLHFQVEKNGATVDPELYLRKPGEEDQK
ncbi:peptidoglycan DD-metalloendopeptidase family protein [Paenibacillus sp. FSL R5-0527]|uniref:M23 family metallopeptidase n=1 Tax=Paenibacillus sp. FSL R5-0527 TaxID=2975321 RepID=UPI00097A389C|nr:peptidase M23 [Paenibacillus macerans]